MTFPECKKLLKINSHGISNINVFRVNRGALHPYELLKLTMSACEVSRSLKPACLPYFLQYVAGHQYMSTVTLDPSSAPPSIMPCTKANPRIK